MEIKSKDYKRIVMKLKELLNLPQNTDVLIGALKYLELTNKGICLDENQNGLLDQDNNPLSFGKVYYIAPPGLDNPYYCIPINYKLFPFQELDEDPKDLRYLCYHKESHKFTVKSLSGYDKKLFKNLQFDIHSKEFQQIILKEEK